MYSFSFFNIGGKTKKAKILGIVLFWLTLISPIISFALAGIIDEMHIFGVMVNMNVFLLNIKKFTKSNHIR